jgi:hypothetical protein
MFTKTTFSPQLSLYDLSCRGRGGSLCSSLRGGCEHRDPGTLAALDRYPLNECISVPGHYRSALSLHLAASQHCHDQQTQYK